MRVFFRLEKAMARQEIILGTPPTGLGGDTPRVASSKINAMTLEIYQGIGTPAAPLAVARGGNGPSPSTPFSSMRDSLPLSQEISQAERRRMKLFEPSTYVLDMDDVSTTQVLGPGYVSTTTVGTKPPGWAYGILETILSPTDHVQQVFTGLSGIAGVTHPSFRRTGYGVTSTRWGPWRLVIDSDTASSPVESGGILKRTVVGGIAITKYADGRNIANGTFQANTVSLSAGSTVVSIALPFSIGADDGFSTANIVVQPSNTYDHYGAISAYITNSGTVLNVAIRNGAGAQTFKVIGTIMGHWK